MSRKLEVKQLALPSRSNKGGKQMASGNNKGTDLSLNFNIKLHNIGAIIRIEDGNGKSSNRKLEFHHLSQSAVEEIESIIFSDYEKKVLNLTQRFKEVING